MPPRQIPDLSNTLPAQRPLRLHAQQWILTRLATALACGDGVAAAHCIHELWMRAPLPGQIDAALSQIWRDAAPSIPEWLPMRYIDWLPLVYEVAARFHASAGRSHIYLVLLDYSDGHAHPYGIYVGMSHYAPAVRFDQHKAGIRAAGSVLKRGIEILTGPVLHLQNIRRAQAARIEEQLAEALRAEGLTVQGGH
jgi:hypothetical protein